MRKIIMIIAALLMLGIPTVALAKESPELNEKEIITAALFHVVGDQKTNSNSLWKNLNVSAENPIPVMNSSDEIESYIVNLKVGKKEAGYVEISNNQDEFPVISYSYISNRLGDKALDQFRSKKSKNKIQEDEEVVLVGPGKFALKVDYDDNSSDVIDESGIINISSSSKLLKTISHEKKYNEDSKPIWKQIKAIASGEIGNDSDGVTDSLGFETGYSNVNYSSYYTIAGENQFTSTLWAGPSGCAPTSAYNIAYYWANTKGKTNMIRPATSTATSKEATVWNLRTSMGTNSNGSTLIDQISTGLTTYAWNIAGYRSSYVLSHKNASWDTIKNDLSYGPTLLTMTGQTYYNNGDPNSGHTVAGVGWIEFFYNGNSSGHQYINIRDNWHGTDMVFLAYGRNYSSLESDQVVIK